MRYLSIDVPRYLADPQSLQATAKVKRAAVDEHLQAEVSKLVGRASVWRLFRRHTRASAERAVRQSMEFQMLDHSARVWERYARCGEGVVLGEWERLEMALCCDRAARAPTHNGYDGEDVDPGRPWVAPTADTQGEER